MSLMPGVNSLEVFQQAVNEFDVTSLRLTIDPAALAAARQSLDQSGLLLLGEVHGVRQNPLVARALMAALEVTGLALEWPAGLATAVSGFFADGRVPDHAQLWGGDGRITVGHFALLRERFLAERLQALTLFDGVNEAGWSRREAAMAERILGAQVPGSRTLVIAGSAHTALTPTMLGVPIGARLAQLRPGVRLVPSRDGKVPAASLFSGPYYFLEQLGFRKVIDTTFMIGTMIHGDPDPEDLRKFFRALRKAQRDIDLRPELYTHYYKNEFPDRFHALMDTRRWGPGERLVFEPYTKEVYEESFEWIADHHIFAEGDMGAGQYDNASLSLVS